MLAVATSVDPRTRLKVQPGSGGNTLRYEPFGAARDLFLCTDPEIVLDGPAGTGKSLACLKKLDRNAVKYPGCRQLIVRKTRTSLTQSALVTFEQRVVIPGGRVRFHTTLQAYQYPNGSIIVVGGMDKDSKVMSSEYDTIYVQEATELLEPEWEALTTRLRYGVMPYQQLIADVNPVQPTHWINRRCNDGRTKRLLSRHEDNPTLWDRANTRWTQFGADYIATLERLTGVRRERLRYGRWVAAEGTVFPFDRAVHVITESPFVDGVRPASVGAAVDWGYTHPGVIQVGQIDGDGRIIVPRIVYRTHRTIDWWITEAQKLKAEFGIEWFVCDPSEPGYIEQFNQAGLNAFAAQNAILPGIDAVQQRLAIAGDGRVRLQFMADCLPDPDDALSEAKKPLSTLDEFDVYVWDKGTANRERSKEKPVDANNHGMDVTRYLVMQVDFKPASDWAHTNADDLTRVLGVSR